MTVTLLTTFVAVLLVQTIKGEEIEENVNFLAELPLRELLMQRKNLGRTFKSEKISTLLPFQTRKPITKNANNKAALKKPFRKVFSGEFNFNNWMNDLGSMRPSKSLKFFFFQTTNPTKKKVGFTKKMKKTKTTTFWTRRWRLCRTLRSAGTWSA